MKTIDQFIWGYQQHFRGKIRSLARSTLESIGFEGECEVLLVALLQSDKPHHFEVCIEPEDGRWGQELFVTLPQAAKLAFKTHPSQEIFYSDGPSMKDKPENIRRLSISEEVSHHLKADDERHGVKSFCSLAIPVGDYYVVTVVQVSLKDLTTLPVIEYRYRDVDIETNLLLGCIRQILGEAENELSRSWPEPGRMFSNFGLGASEIINRAVNGLMASPFIPGDLSNPGLFTPFEEITKLMYEGRINNGRFILAQSDDPNLDYVLKLSSPVPVNQSRWVRKLLQMATRENALIMGYSDIYGLGSVSDVSADPFVVDVTGRHQWELKKGEATYIRVRDGTTKLPREQIRDDRFEDNMSRLFDGIKQSDIARAQNVMKLLFNTGRGSTVVFTNDAADEAIRLANQGTRIQPTALSKELLERASCIDGAIIADPTGVCHAIGVILDGSASSLCTPSRGARYNSAVRYVGDRPNGRMALVVSDDSTLDIVPMLRLQIARDTLEAAVSQLENSSNEDYYKPRLFLHDHRFYLNADQCERINQALDRIENEPLEVGRFILMTSRFEPNPEMNSSYFKKERAKRHERKGDS